MSRSILQKMKPFIQKVWEKSQFKEMTAVQTEVIPKMLEGKNVIASSPTGTGKTLAYLLPVLNKIDPEKRAVQAVILASSQELVMQIFQELQKWGEGSGIRFASLIGGANVKRQMEKLKKHPHIIAGTPGRTYELIQRKKLKMHEVRTIVLDEGDQLLTFEHLPAVQNIIRSTLADRQVALFSATLSEYDEQEARALMNDAEVIRIEREQLAEKGRVDHIYFLSEQRDKIKLLEKISRLPDLKALVFMRDIGNINQFHDKLLYKEIETSVLHSELTKDQRKKALKAFRKGLTSMLLATDVAARGLDIQGVTHVVHFDFPKDIEQYIHRSGRTGRLGADGTVISLVTEREERELKKYARQLKLTVIEKRFYGGEIVDQKNDRKRF